MNEPEFEGFEAELRNLKPTQLPALLRLRIMAELPTRTGQRPLGSLVTAYWRWLMPATALLLLAALVLGYATHRVGTLAPKSTLASVNSPLKADKLEIDRHLIARFDAIGRLPNGQPIRFRCAQWLDNVRVRDSATGLLIERTAPRLEIVPVGFEAD